MLEGFLVRRRSEIVHWLRERAGSAEARNGLPVFLDQLGAQLARVRSGVPADAGDMGRTAGLHGADLLRAGLSVRQVVHDYGDVCQAVTELSISTGEALSPEDFRLLNWALDQAIAEAVSEWTRLHDEEVSRAGVERLGVLAHEMRNQLNSAMLAYEAVRSGRTAVGGATGALLGRALQGVRRLIDRTLADVRIEAGLERPEALPAASLVEEVEVGARLQGEARGVLVLASCPRTAWVFGDRQVLTAALSNLLHNAVKFSRPGGGVRLDVAVEGPRVLFAVSDACGGLPPGSAEGMFRPFEQRSGDRSGLGLGLAVVQRAAEGAGGTCTVRDVPGTGCVFTIDLPSVPPPGLRSLRGGGTGSAGAPPGSPGALSRARSASALLVRRRA